MYWIILECTYKQWDGQPSFCMLYNATNYRGILGYTRIHSIVCMCVKTDVHMR